ncbi:MAG TPA: pyridoxal 5'-phosphate synthase glutaminase subunit PdxT [Thermoplasmatales archaeon]|nr:pyridoxal 5'-phosphate synthase glutaminase subunit PdxT [Thermoplasmatales archaeon]
MRVAIIAAQGDVEEHVLATKKAMENMGIEGEAFATIKKEEVAKSDAIILPGGESTTISKLIHKSSVADEIIKAAKEGKAVMGTCAGCILLAKHGDEEVRKTGTKLLGLMDIWIRRNAFGRQRESFQTMLDIKGIGKFEAVFIRAPAILKVGEGVDVMATLDNFIVAARQDNLLALTFHPELTDDTRLHEYFIKMAI